MTPCKCMASHTPKRMVLTGGPGAGKTAVLELIRQSFCAHVRVLPEAAGIIFGGGFPREQDDGCRRASQRAIYHVQRELEAAAASHDSAIVLCDRGTVDGLAYWPGTAAEFWSGVQSTPAIEFSRYDLVIHLRVPGADGGYNRQNPLRIESAAAAAEIDQRILTAWRDHPRRFTVNAAADFLEKVSQSIAILRDEMPACCRSHDIAELTPRVPSHVEPGL
jgi:predicted ATPase